MFLELAISLQSISAVDAKKGLDALTARADKVMTEAFDCMDQQTKTQLKAHLLDATPQIVVNAAALDCDHLRASYATALVAPDSYITPASAETMATDWFKGLRELYIKHVDESLASPKLAEVRTDYVLAKWRTCVTEKASDWSRLEDDASSVAQAAVTSCETFMPHVREALGYSLRSKGLPASRSGESADKLRPTMKEVAVARVISERAKRLPKK